MSKSRRKAYHECDNPGRPAIYFAWEWVDPREPLFPKFINFGPVYAPWDNFWRFRQHLGGKLGHWLRDLDASGCKPELSYWRFARAIPLPRKIAADLAEYRVWEVSYALSDQFDDPPIPPFLCNESHPARFHQPIKEVRPDGSVKVHYSQREAAKAAGLYLSEMQSLIQEGRLSPCGSFYCLS